LEKEVKKAKKKDRKKVEWIRRKIERRQSR
jgi:hypothetical protein